MQRRLTFSRVAGLFAICRLPPNTAVPDWALRGSFFSVTSTADELSIVCPEAQVPAEVQHEKEWACLKLEGPFPFSETGILTSFVRPLSEHAIPIFAVATFDTDYVLVKQAWVEKAVEALQEAGHEPV
ncbi:MAG: ACT domain-containing protein [Terriglobales bacterium]